MTSPMWPSVGWIGLGRIGAPMAARLLDAGCTLNVWARRREAAQPLLDRGAVWCASPEALAQRSQVLVSCVGGPADVLEVHGALLPHAPPGTMVLELSTASPATALALQDLAATAHVLDCPVTGGVAGARQGRLTSFVGGEASVLERCRPLLATWSQRIVHCGGAGAGYRMKLVNQTIVAGTLLGLAEGSALARDSGFGATLVQQALGEGTASGTLFHSYIARMIDLGGEATFTLGMFAKDLQLARDEAARSSGGSALLDFAVAAADRACARFGPEAGVQLLASPELG